MPVMCREGSSTLRSHQYQGIAAQNIVHQTTFHQWFVHHCWCWKLFLSIIVCNLCFKYTEQKQKEGSQHQTADFNWESTELCWIFCYRWTFSLRNYEKQPPPMVDSQCGPHLLATLCYDHFIIVGNRIYHMSVYS